MDEKMEEMMKRGYPDPNYTEDDVIALDIVTVKAWKFEELVRKAAQLDLLIKDIKEREEVEPAAVHAITGTTWLQMQENKKGDQELWFTEFKKNQELKAQVEALETEKAELNNKLAVLQSRIEFLELSGILKPVPDALSTFSSDRVQPLPEENEV